MNKVILCGNLCADPEVRTTSTGISQCTFRIAVQRRFANQQGVRESDFFTVVCWRQTADFVSRFFTKGRKILVEGTIQNRSYDAQDGSKRTVTEIIAENCEFCDSRNDGPAAAPRTYNTPAAPQAPAAGAFTPVDNDDELPF